MAVYLEKITLIQFAIIQAIIEIFHHAAAFAFTRADGTIGEINDPVVDALLLFDFFLFYSLLFQHG